MRKTALALSLVTAMLTAAASSVDAAIPRKEASADAIPQRADGSWARGAPMLAGRGWFGAAVVDGLLYAVGGDGRGSTEVYRPATDTWKFLDALPNSRDWFAVAAQGGKVYAFGGFVAGADTPHSSHESDRYDPASDRWTRVAAMPTDRYGAAAVTGKDGRIYVLGGWSTRSNTALTTLEVYHPDTNSWHVRASMHAARQSPGAARDSLGRIYAIGGYNSAHGYLKSVERYDPSTNRWVAVRGMHVARAALAAATGADGRIYAIGGFNSGLAFRYRKTVEVYLPWTNRWRQAPSLLTARANLAAARLGPKIRALGGQNTSGVRLRANEALRTELHG